MEELREEPKPPYINRRPRMVHVSKAPTLYTQMYGEAEANSMFGVVGTLRHPCRKCARNKM